MQWKIDYSISSSYLHTSLVKNLTAALNHKFSALDDFTTVANIEIRQGSVLVWFEAQFDSELSTETKMKVMQTVSKMKASGLTVGGVHYSSADIVVKNGTCPNMQGMVGDCQQRCQTDSNCTGDMKCCSNGCGHVCMHPVVKHDPCKNVTCPSGTSCQDQQVQCVVPPCHPVALCVATPCTSHSDCLNGGSCSDGKCFCFGPYSGSRCQYESVVKNGSCPNVTGIVGTCVSRCQTDNNCTGNMKCCSNGCGHVCMQPVVKHDPCKNVTCPSGKTCRPQQVQCFRAPCYPVAQCVGTPCTTFPYEPYTDCQNGGSCANGKCFCFGPYYGDRCQLVVKNGTCPNMQGMVGDCQQRCQTDSNCTGDMKCCSNGCGHVCMHPVVKHDPCKNVTCPSGKTCRPQQVQCFRAPCYPVAQCVATPCTVFPYEPYSDCQNGGSCFSGKCECFGLYYGDRCQYEAVVKNGTCPNMQGMVGDCQQRCQTDSNCTGDMKCCSNGCGHVCMHPVVKRDPCKNVSCPFGTVCRPQQVECFTTPCYPIAQCVSEKGCNSSMDCMNGGSCDNGKCQCYKKYYGDRCEQALTDISVCESNLDCYNGGQCLQGRCACKASFYGYGCLLTSNFTAINCQETLCENGGSCYGSSCYCPDSFFGKTCQYSVREDVDTYRKFRSDLKINMPWRESFRELSDHQIMKTTLESQLRQVFASVPNFDRVEITSFRPGSVVAYYTAHFTDVIDQDSVLSTAKALDNITVNFFGINYSVLPHDDCRSSQHSCVNGGCKLSSNGTYECVCQPTFTGKSCDENVCSGFMCMYGFQCYVTHMGKPRCNCSYGFGEHCENVPCGCDPNSERCIKRDVCTNGECTPQETCVALNYTGPCMYSKCLYGECVETVDSGSYCKCMDNYKGAICDTKKSICDMLPVDVCAYYGSKCVGDIMDGRLCECPSGKRGAFCELDGYATTKCQRQSDLYQTAINILNGTYTVPLIPNAAQIVRTMLRGTFGSDFIPNMKCLENGDYAPMQCNVNIYSMNTTACYCMNSEGMQLTQRVPDPMGYPACTGPSVSPVAQALCGAAYSDAICLNGGSCVGDLMGSHPRLCHCREGFTGVVCQRRLESNEQPENFTKCTLGSDIYRLMDDIVHGKFKFVITVSGINITITPDMILNLFRMFGGGTLTNYATTEPTTMPTTTPYWEDLDGGFTTATTTVDEGQFMNTNDEDYFTNTPSTTVPPQTWETGDWYTTQTVPTVTSDSDYFTNTPSTTVPPQTWETGDWYTTQTVPTVTSDSDFSTTTSYPETFATTPSYSSNSTSDAHTFLSRYECTHDGKFKPLQCEYNLLTKERGACRCVYQNGSIVPGSRSWSPGNHHCKSVMPDECPKMKCFITCEHGFLQDLKGCDICMCRKPCHGKMCGMGQRCVNETSYDRMRCNERYSCQVPVCRKMHKRGVCPAGAVATMESLKKMFLDSYHTCDIQCHDDADCEGNMKCCGACGNKCVKPFDPETCFEKKAIMDVHWALYQNMSTYLSDDTNIKMANSTYPQVLKGAMSWLRHMQVMWLPNCTRAGDYERVQCEYSVKTNDTVNCFCVNDDGLRVDRTDVMPPNTPDCSDKPGMCPQVSADVFGTCPQECENDFGCTGSQKCCSNGCGHICMKPVNFTGPSKAMNMNAMLAKLCKGKDLCKYGYCAADWKKGDLCRCSPGWTGVTCDKRRTGTSSTVYPLA
ncbi:neurogenic locus notch homolog protein 2-like [Gigantopelta aegis]|uniref:neurogenic locus notch homolog protein 2-like n=1 Tax=Gigantopelta aegis TaxID=1735272 RepID=UPI001B88C9C1|nr:neurogenic locus notch homolog protein 2-like [Gigantopelta aegis]